ncbi:hypothetical protein [Variovorax saccharolyticus]|uniref:hypothetical protein n=1 Tax=Variovorax saccharolyticus TaxID=3053516 RepID=UPI002575A265|nr:hypothetical protein [Variovorax sp. J31P216]MDM0030474.1 hypothetical protein [Variovorax sp. J31P216]
MNLYARMKARLWPIATEAACPSGEAAMEFRSLAPAQFRWTDPSTGLALELGVIVYGVKLSNGSAEMKMAIKAHDIQMVVVVHGRESLATVYLCNYFFVPKSLKRRGLATAALLAFVQTYQLAVFECLNSSQPLLLEGYFVGEGVAFATTLCGGVLPTKADPQPIDLLQLQSAQHMLRLEKPPLRQVS